MCILSFFLSSSSFSSSSSSSSSPSSSPPAPAPPPLLLLVLLERARACAPEEGEKSVCGLSKLHLASDREGGGGGGNHTKCPCSILTRWTKTCFEKVIVALNLETVAVGSHVI